MEVLLASACMWVCRGCWSALGIALVDSLGACHGRVLEALRGGPGSPPVARHSDFESVELGGFAGDVP